MPDNSRKWWIGWIWFVILGGPLLVLSVGVGLSWLPRTAHLPVLIAVAVIYVARLVYMRRLRKHHAQGS
jgi:hypothetical protein